MELLFEIAGWTGAVAMLGGYMAVSMGWLQAGSTFQTVNLFGSCAFIINGTLHGAWPSVVTNVAWFLISAVALLRMRAKLRAAEAPALAQESPSLGPDTAAQVIVAAARPDTAAQVLVAAARPAAGCA
ncbi:CBU_0592 family membrane protein [Arthrobacter sp. 31Y]|uniref:CBU_0592 family membrane protein n=1 Tax=Arthrobacter sp. 31Y TaxID=1115632 RepID=UPI000465628B|nr:YgjV family protein [Arthrobacter sp. 31Y]